MFDLVGCFVDRYNWISFIQTIYIIAMTIRAVLSRLDLNLLAVFEALYHAASVSRAAEQLGLSQPALSAALKRLREALHDPLFVRHAHGLVPTPRSEQLIVSVQAILDRVESEVLRTPEFTPSQETRAFTLNMIDLGELVVLPDLINRLRVEAPHVQIHCVSLAGAALHEAFASGTVDLAIGHFPVLAEANLPRQRLFRHSYIALAARGHLSLRGAMNLDQFQSADHVIVEPASGIGAHIEAELARHGVQRRVALAVSHYLALPALIARSELVAVVPHAAGVGLAAMAELQLLALPMRLRTGEVHQFWHARTGTDAGVKWLRGVVASLFLQRSRREARV